MAGASEAEYELLPAVWCTKAIFNGANWDRRCASPRSPPTGCASTMDGFVVMACASGAACRPPSVQATLRAAFVRVSASVASPLVLRKTRRGRGTRRRIPSADVTATCTKRPSPSHTGSVKARATSSPCSATRSTRRRDPLAPGAAAVGAGPEVHGELRRRRRRRRRGGRPSRSASRRRLRRTAAPAGGALRRRASPQPGRHPVGGPAPRRPSSRDARRRTAPA